MAWILSVLATAAPAQTLTPQEPRFYLGLRTVPLNADWAHRLGLDRAEGVVVGQVYAGSPADRAGLRGGDVIIQYAGQPVASAAQLAQLAEKLPIGSRHRLVAVRQRQPIELEMEIGAPPAVRGSPKAPGPSRDEAWYLHGTGDFWFRIPQNWKSKGGYRNQVVDPEFDSIYSPDGRYVLICFKGFDQAATPQTALEKYVREKIAENPHAHAWSMRVAGKPAVRVAYLTRDRQNVVYRVSFCHAGRQYIINAVAPGSEPVESLPKEVAATFESLQFLRRPVDEDKLAGSVVPSPGHSPPAKTPEPTSGNSVQSGALPAKPLGTTPPPNWVSHNVGGLKVWVPPELKAVSMADPKEARWTKEINEDLLVSFGIVNDVSAEQLTRWMKSPVRRTMELAGGVADVYVGGMSDSGVAGRGMMVFPRSDDPIWKGRGFCCFSVEDQWPQWEKVFRKILETLRPANVPP